MASPGYCPGFLWLVWRRCALWERQGHWLQGGRTIFPADYPKQSRAHGAQGAGAPGWGRRGQWGPAPSPGLVLTWVWPG